jgi:hypothetical protein
MDVYMYVDRGKRSHQERTIEFLAGESQVPIAEVARLYEAEWAVLEDGARVTSFLAIFTARNVRDLLRRRSTGKRRPT